MFTLFCVIFSIPLHFFLLNEEAEPGQGKIRVKNSQAEEQQCQGLEAGMGLVCGSHRREAGGWGVDREGKPGMK